MFKKVNTTVLIVALIILLGIYFAVRYFDRSDRSFKEVILDYQPEQVYGITIQDPQNEAPVKITREGDNWKVVKNGKKYPADSNVVKNILTQVGALRTKKYAGKGEEIWEKYQVNDSLATVVELSDGKETLAKVYIGRFAYSMGNEQQQQQMMMQGRQNQPTDMTTYVRLAGEKEVYGVDGFLKMNFNRDADSYRDKTIANFNSSDITSVTLKMPTGNLDINKADGNWKVNGIPADSAKTVGYFNKLGSLRGTTFVNEDLVNGVKPGYQAEIRGNNFLSLDINAFPVADTNVNYVINSTQNPSSYFNGSKSNLFDKIFVDISELLPEEK